MSRVVKWNSVSLPNSVIAGQSFIISVDVSAIEALFEKSSRAMIDVADDILLPSDGEYKSAYSGEEIDNFIAEVLL